MAIMHNDNVENAVFIGASYISEPVHRRTYLVSKRSAMIGPYVNMADKSDYSLRTI